MGFFDDLGDNIAGGIEIDANYLGRGIDAVAGFSGKTIGKALGGAANGLLGDNWLLILGGVLTAVLIIETRK